MKDLEKELVEKLVDGTWHGYCDDDKADARTEITEQVLPLIRSHTQALVAAAYAACAEHHPQDDPDKVCKCSCGVVCESWAQWEAHIRSLTPADAARELERRDESVRADTIMRFRKVLDRLNIHGYYNEMQREFGCDEASLTKPAPVERSNENG